MGTHAFSEDSSSCAMTWALDCPSTCGRKQSHQEGRYPWGQQKGNPSSTSVSQAYRRTVMLPEVNSTGFSAHPGSHYLCDLQPRCTSAASSATWTLTASSAQPSACRSLCAREAAALTPTQTLPTARQVLNNLRFSVPSELSLLAFLHAVTSMYSSFLCLATTQLSLET